MTNFHTILSLINSLDRTSVVTEEDFIKVQKISKYLKGLRNYGLYPTLTLLDEYEKAENYLECHYIMEALAEQVKVLKKLNQLPDSTEDFPTRISQFQIHKYKKMFDIFGLTGETAIRNNRRYVEEIKKL